MHPKNALWREESQPQKEQIVVLLTPMSFKKGKSDLEREEAEGGEGRVPCTGKRAVCAGRGTPRTPTACRGTPHQTLAGGTDRGMN